MAYNVLKGSVQGSVDQHADQEIDGVKVFKNTVSASVFWDTDAQSPCATMKDVAIKNIKGNVNDGLIVCDKEHGARTHHNLKYSSDTETLSANTIAAKTFVGSGIYLQDVPNDAFTGPIDANFLNHGLGLQNLRGTLQVRANNGLTANEDGIGISLSANSGISIKSNKLSVDPTKLQPINTEGQNLSDNDSIIVADVSRGTTTNTTLSNLYDSYIKTKVPCPVGELGTIQFKGKRNFQSSNSLIYDDSKNTLSIEGTVNSNIAVSKNKLMCQGSVYHNITKTKQKLYNVEDSDYTIICDAQKNNVDINLPPAQNNIGRVLIVKKADSGTIKLTSNKVNVVCEDSKIDLSNRVEIKMNYSSRTFQSDGENWHIIGTKGT
tara:strand:- start:154 stop:1287 length:1134 start_codon:yes stop_codon:yes gene_type:complete